MAKFCKFCGKQLEEGEVCACTQNTQPQAEVPQAPAAAPVQAAQTSSISADEIKSQLTGFWAMFKEFVKKPVSVGKSLINKCDFKSALFYIGAQAVLVALLMIILAGKFNSAISKSVFPLFKIFLVSLVSSFGFSCILAAVLMLIIKLFKGNTNYKYMLCASSVNSLTCIPFILLAILVSFVTPIKADIGLGNFASGTIGFISSALTAVTLPIAIASIGMTLGYFILLGSVSGGAQIDKDKVPYVMFVVNLVMALALYLILRMAIPMCMPSASDMIGNAGSDIGSILGGGYSGKIKLP